MAKTIKTVTTTEGEGEVEVIEAGTSPTQVGKLPIVPTEEEDKVIFNSVAQRVDKETAEKKDAYINSDGRVMLVQQESEGMIFAGENGTNAQWYPKEILDTWTKLPAAAAPQATEGDSVVDEEFVNDSRYGETVEPYIEYVPEGEGEGEGEGGSKSGKKQRKHRKEEKEEEKKVSEY